MILPGLRIGLQEWSVCIQALALGRSCVLIRKGGIHEPRGGLFMPEHERFALLPSYLHQAAERLHPQYGGEFLAHSVASAQPGVIPVTIWAEVARVWKCTELSTAQALGEEVPWSAAEIATRFNYRQQPFLFVLALRVQRLPALVALPDRPSYGGCRSWISLEDPVPTEGSTPVISDAPWAARLAQLDGLLGAKAQGA